MSKRDWKSALLSSSLPLEHEAAKILSRQGYEVESDYSYRRLDESGAFKSVYEKPLTAV